MLSSINFDIEIGLDKQEKYIVDETAQTNKANIEDPVDILVT